jgi:hypothetical protein
MYAFWSIQVLICDIIIAGAAWIYLCVYSGWNIILLPQGFSTKYAGLKLKCLW